MQLRLSGIRKLGYSLTMMKSFALNLGLTLASLLIVAVIAEIILRFLPVTSGLQALAVNESDPVLHFQPNNDYVYSKGPLLKMVNRGHVNVQGFVNDQDYSKDARRPLIAVVGDSYVEALMVPYPETIHGRLASALEGRASVYSFAASGAALSQYLVWADYARGSFTPDALIIVVVGNDFDESLAEYKRSPGLHDFKRTPYGGLELERVNYQPTILRMVLRKSALIRYLVINCNVEGLLRNPSSWLANKTGGQSYAGNTDSNATPKRVADSREAVREFLSRLPLASGLPAERILFLVDGFRYPQTGEKLADSYFAKMRNFFLTEATARGFEAVDMDNSFFLSNPDATLRFEFPIDGHWNSLAHNFAADQAIKSKTIKGLTQSTEN